MLHIHIYCTLSSRKRKINLCLLAIVCLSLIPLWSLFMFHESFHINILLYQTMSYSDVKINWLLCSAIWWWEVSSTSQRLCSSILFPQWPGKRRTLRFSFVTTWPGQPSARWQENFLTPLSLLLYLNTASWKILSSLPKENVRWSYVFEFHTK